MRDRRGKAIIYVCGTQVVAQPRKTQKRSRRGNKMNKILAVIAVTMSFSCGAFAGGLDELKSTAGSEAVDSLKVPAVSVAAVDPDSKSANKFVASTARQLKKAIKFYSVEAKVRLAEIKGLGPILSVEFATQNGYDRFKDILDPDGHYNGVLVATTVVGQKPLVDPNSKAAHRFAASTARQLRKVLKFYNIDAKVRLTEIYGLGPVLNMEFATQNDYDRFEDILASDGHYNGTLVAFKIVGQQAVKDSDSNRR